MIQFDPSQTENKLGQLSRCTGDSKKPEGAKSKVSDSKTVSVLVVEDNPADARLIREMLAEARRTHFNVVCVDRLSTALDRVRKEKIDAVLLDLSLPDSWGVGTFVKMLVTAPRVPVVVFSGLDDEDTALQAVQRGAQDYLVKGHIDSHSLVCAIRYSTERKRAEEQIRELNQILERRVT
jgi:PleD family two-component response regulator